MPQKSSYYAFDKLFSAARYGVYVLLYFLSRITRQSEISVLMYHSVSPASSKYSVIPAEFRRQMDHLMKNYTIVSLNEIMEFVEGKRTLPRKSVAITFDDGYLDNYTNAYPYLRKYQLPATIFIATNYVQKEMRLGNSYLPMLGWKEIAEMNQNDVEFGAHTSSHPDLLRIDIQTAEREILESKAQIEKRIGKEADSFAYPFGRYQSDVADLVKRIGFRCAFGGEGGIRKDADRFAVHRVEVKRSINLPLFKIRLTTALDWYKILHKAFARACTQSPLKSTILGLYNRLESQD